MSILAKLTDGKVELTDGWTNRVLCALDITSAALLATEIQAIAAVYKVEAPNPLPPPALGMRVWTTGADADGYVCAHSPVDVKYLRPGSDWSVHCIDPDTINLITDFRTGEVIWRRS